MGNWLKSKARASLLRVKESDTHSLRETGLTSSPIMLQYIGKYRYIMTTLPIPADLLNFLKSLASESRLNIVLLFLDGQERTVNQIAEAVGLGQPATSEHLALLSNPAC